MISAIEPKPPHKNAETISSPLDELRQMADALPITIARVDREGRYRFNNRAYENWFGLRPDELYGRAVREVVGEELYRKIEPHMTAAFAGEKQIFESSLVDKNGQSHQMQVNYIPHFNADGVVEEIYVFVVDITEFRDAQEQVRRLNSDLEKRVQERTAQLEFINRELEAFCYSVSHDLRAPLRAVRGFTEVLLEQYISVLDPRGQDFLRRVSEASSHMDRLVEDLLKLSRVTRAEVQKENVDLSTAAAGILSEIAKTEPARKVATVIAPELSAHGDERLLRLVMENLLRNAWKFTGKNPAARVEFGQLDDADHTFFVRDNGVGFDMNYAGKLFRVFQRLHSAGDFPGSGVGLAIVQRIINRHGGRVWAEARAGEGATFYFSLPANDSNDEQENHSVG